MIDSQAREAAEKNKGAIKDLCAVLGISFQERWDGELKINEYHTMHGANENLRPLTKKDLKIVDANVEETKQYAYGLNEEFMMLLKHLGLEITEGKRIEKIKEDKK